MDKELILLTMTADQFAEFTVDQFEHFWVKDLVPLTPPADKDVSKEIASPTTEN
jgi:hypothetical protein